MTTFEGDNRVMHNDKVRKVKDAAQKIINKIKVHSDVDLKILNFGHVGFAQNGDAFIELVLTVPDSEIEK